eukprot:4007569-Amphidinium_carterae.1
MARDSGKRHVEDPHGSVLDLISTFGVSDRGGFYDRQVRGKVIHFDRGSKPGSAAAEAARSVPRQLQRSRGGARR